MQQSSRAESSGPNLPPARRFFRRVRSSFLQFEPLYRLNLKWKYGAGRISTAPNGVLPNAVLRSREEWMEATARGGQLHLPLHRSPEKNWDHLAAVDAIRGNLPASARVLDAGAEFYSNVLPALFVYGFHDLYGMNLSFADPAQRGPIRYLPGDITRTGFPDGFFDAITCMSVIEHGVPLEAYFREAHRLLKPGGLLITSTDYFPVPIDTSDKFAHGSPIRIFSRRDVEEMLRLAEACGFEQTGEINLDCANRAVRWDLYGLEFTFVIFTLRKR